MSTFLGSSRSTRACILSRNDRPTKEIREASLGRKGPDGRYHRPGRGGAQPRDTECVRHPAHHAERGGKPANARRPLHRRALGAGVQHIASHTDEIFATAATLCKNGFRPLAITPNDYGDVEARFGLASALTERLKAENILYDRDELGEFFQLYSPTYAGYGAANAIFRIAALKKLLRPDGLPKP